MAIDRENPRNSMKTLLKAIDFIKSGQGSIGIYPEGTRSKDGKLLPFHDGIFKVAQKAGVPVVVGSIVGTEQIKSRFPFRRTVVKVDFIDVIQPQEGQTSHEIAELAKTLISERIESYEGGMSALNELNAEIEEKIEPSSTDSTLATNPIASNASTSSTDKKDDKSA